MFTFLHDLKFAARQLIRHGGYTIISILTLALGLGANAAIFSVVNAFLLKPLPYANPTQLVQVWGTTKGGGLGTASIPDWTDWRQQANLFQDFAIYQSRSFNLDSGANPEHVSGREVSGNFFDVMGTRPTLGRTFAPGEDTAGRQQVAVLSDALWRRLGANPAIGGTKISLNDQPYTVIGVMPPNFKFPSATAEVWAPLVPDPKFAVSRGNNQYFCVARMKTGVKMESAQSQMTTISARISKQYPDSNANRSVVLVSLQRQLAGPVRQSLLVLLAAVGFVFLIACVNVVNLNLTRTASRQREIAVRRAMGASGARLFRQFITESILLTLVGSAVGWLLAQWVVQILVAANQSPLPTYTEVNPDARVFGFELILALIAALALATATAWKATRVNVQQTLKEGGRAITAGRAHQRTSKILVVVEVAASVVLLAGAGLMLRTFASLRKVDTGFPTPERVLTMAVSLPDAKYASVGSSLRFLQPARARIEAIPGVTAVGAINFLPVQAWGINGDFEIVGHLYPDPANNPGAELRAVDGDFYRAMGLPLLQGRSFTASDTKDSEFVAIINQRAALDYWPKQDPIGSHIHLSGDKSPIYTIVGVVRDSTQPGPSGHVQPEIDVPFSQWPNTWPDFTRSFSIVVRTASSSTALAETVRHAIQEVDSRQPVYLVMTMAQVLDESTANTQFNAFFLAVFAAVALVLAAIGIYGVLSYGVRQRTHEIGVRMALGADPVGVLRMVIGEGLLLNLIGLVLGLAGSLYLTRFLSSLLFGVKATDIETFAAVAVVLTFVVMLACYIPARRAMKVDPMVALRYE